MIKTIAKFTGLAVESKYLSAKFNKRKHPGSSCPVSWHRIVIADAPVDGISIDHLDAFLDETITGRWGMLVVNADYGDNSRICLAFESEDDAMLFKLMDGGARWKESLRNKEEN